MSNSPNNELQRIIEDHRKVLMDKITAAYKQLGFPISEADKVAVQSQIDSFELELEQIDRKLAKLSKNTNRLNLDLQTHLPKIDFKKAVEIINNFLAQPTGEEIEEKNAVLFLIQNAENTEGKKCVKRLKSILEDDLGAILPIEITCSVTSNITNKVALITQIGRHVGLPQITQEGDLVSYTQTVIEKICGRLSTVFIELHNWDFLEPKKDLLPWFLKNFWCPLLQHSSTVLQQYPGIRFVTIITAKGDILTSDPSLNEYCINDWSQFDKSKAFELVLQTHWTQKEVMHWLNRYSGCDATQIAKWIEVIYPITNGNPDRICRELEELNT